MKRTHIALIIIIAVAMGAIMVSLGDASTYVNFEQAERNPGTKYTVIGYLDKEAAMNYDAQANLQKTEKSYVCLSMPLQRQCHWHLQMYLNMDLLQITLLYDLCYL